MKKTSLALCLAMLLLLTGCNSAVKQYDTNTLVLGKDHIQDISVEDYSGVDVTKDALQAYIDEQISEYKDSGAVSVDALTLKDQVAKLAITYSSIDIYNAVNNTDYTLAAGRDWKYDSKDIKGMTSPKDGSLSEDAVTALLADDVKVFVLNGKTDIVVDGTLLAYKNAECMAESVLHGDAGTIVIFK